MDRNVTIYVGNLSFEMTEEELRQEFTIFGEVTIVTIMSDEYIGSGQPSRYGFVEMSEQSAGKAAITSLNGKTLKSRAVKVIEALPLSDNGGSGSHKSRKDGRFTRRERKRPV